jgi:hypothetical protein
MKVTAIVCIILGVLIVIVGIGLVEMERGNLRATSWSIGSRPWVSTERTLQETALQRELEDEAGALTWWTPIIAGAAVSAFGVLILAIVGSRPTGQRRQ